MKRGLWISLLVVSFPLVTAVTLNISFYLFIGYCLLFDKAALENLLGSMFDPHAGHAAPLGFFVMMAIGLAAPVGLYWAVATWRGRRRLGMA